MSISLSSNVIALPQRAEPALDTRAILAVIPALNEARHIETCIRSLMTGAPELRQISLIVADGGSADDTVQIVKGLMREFPNLRLIANPKRLQSAAMNLAVEKFRRPESAILVRCDAHSIYPENFILSVAEALQRHQTASLVIPMDAIGSTGFEKAVSWIVDTPLGSGGSAHRGGRISGFVDHGHHAGFDLTWYDKTGGYDEDFSHNEDAEYDARVLAAGGKIWIDADIRIRYIPRGTLRSLSRQYYMYGRGRAKTVHKHRARLKIRQVLPTLVFLSCLASLAIAPFFWPAVLIPAGYIATLAVASVLVAVQRRSICGLWAGLASATIHMSWAAGFTREVLEQWLRPRN